MTGSVVCRKVSCQYFILLTGLCWSQKENEAQDGMWKRVLDWKCLALSGFSYILKTHTNVQKHTRTLRIHYIAPLHTSSWLNIIQPIRHTTCLKPPCWPIFPLTETGLHQSSLFLLHVAMCPGASPAGRDSKIPTVLHRNTSWWASMQCQDDTAIC